MMIKTMQQTIYQSYLRHGKGGFVCKSFLPGC